MTALPCREIFRDGRRCCERERVPSRPEETQRALEAIRRSVDAQLLYMSRWARSQAFGAYLESLAASLGTRLETISELARSDQIRPYSSVVVDLNAGEVPVAPRAVRVGVYPLAANPMHWGHLLVGLSAMSSMKLDKVVYVIAGTDRRKPHMLSADIRHRLARPLIEAFAPLFAYSPLALGTNLDGETNLARFLGLNWRQRLEVFYIAGGDHYRRTTAGGEADTIQKLEEVVDECGAKRGGLHLVSAVFVDRTGAARRNEEVRTFIDVRFLPAVPIVASSTAARAALRARTFSEALLALPYSCLHAIRECGLYTEGAEPGRKEGS